MPCANAARPPIRTEGPFQGWLRDGETEWSKSASRAGVTSTPRLLPHRPLRLLVPKPALEGSLRPKIDRAAER
jgi:hypothetical protein